MNKKHFIISNIGFFLSMILLFIALYYDKIMAVIFATISLLSWYCSLWISIYEDREVGV